MGTWSPICRSGVYIDEIGDFDKDVETICTVMHYEYGHATYEYADYSVKVYIQTT